MINLIIAGTAVTLSIPFDMMFSSYKKRYRKRHPGWFIPPTTTCWIGSALQTLAFFSMFFLFDPTSWQSFSSAFGIS